MSSPNSDRPDGQSRADRGQPGAPARGSWQRGRWIVLLLALVCAAPVIASYLAYYVFKPSHGRTNYGTLVEPQRPIPDNLVVTDEAGKPTNFSTLRGRWIMIAVDASACDKACATKLYFMRQIRATQGGERERMLTVWLRTDAQPVPDVIKTAYAGTQMFVADPAAVAAWLPADTGTRVADHIYLVDPNGNLMMRFPKDPNPSKMKGDITKLLKWSSIG